MPGERKRRLVAELIERLRADHAALARAQQATVAGATSEEAKAEHSKDTRALEQTYLARGQAQRVEALRVEESVLEVLRVRLPKEALHDRLQLRKEFRHHHGIQAQRTGKAEGSAHVPAQHGFSRHPHLPAKTANQIPDLPAVQA